MILALKTVFKNHLMHITRLNILLLNFNIQYPSYIHYSFLKIYSMKKIFTLLFSLGILSSVFAQSQYAYSKPFPDRAVVINAAYHHRYVDAYSFTRYERDMQLTRINQMYNITLKNIISMRFVNAAEKLGLIRMIENKRAEQIRTIHARFNDQRNKHNDWYYDKYFNWKR